ncbi:MAG: hypothetical protein KY475_13730, partial [Planctomycetes bacterium]|nr:hypothetical protein [Planctomycetota bacterium]
YLLYDRRKWRLLAGLLLGHAAFAPWAIYQVAVAEGEKNLDWLPKATWDDPLHLLGSFAAGADPYLDDEYFARTAGLIVAAVVLAGACRLGRRGVLLAWLCAGPVVLAGALAVGDFNILVRSRYFAASIAAGAGLAAAALIANKHRKSAIGDTLRAVTAAMFLSLYAVGLVDYFTRPPYTAWREMAAAIEREIQHNEEILIVGSSYRSLAFRYYYYGEDRSGDNRHLSLTPTSRGVWIAVEEGYEAQAEARLRSFQASFPHTRELRMPRGQLFHLTR